MSLARICPGCLGRPTAPGATVCPVDGLSLLPFDADDPLCGSLVAERYLVLEQLGRGGMGQVYRAYQPKMKRLVALKLLAVESSSPTSSRRFLLEVEATAALHSPHSVVIHDVGELPDGRPFLVMELLVGRTLEQILAQEGPLAPARVRRLAQQVCLSLEEAHALGIIHRDLKPGNVMVVRDAAGQGQVKVLDFGLAKLLDQGGPSLTSTGAAMGTPSYMSPEQAQAEEVGPASDLYSLGAMLHELLAGRPPFVGGNVSAVLLQHVLAEPPSLADVLPGSPELAAFAPLVRRCLAKKPVDRPSSAARLRAELGALPLGSLPGEQAGEEPATPGLALAATRSAVELRPPDPRPAGWRSRPGTLALLGGGLLLSSGLGALLVIRLLTPGAGPPRPALAPAASGPPAAHQVATTAPAGAPPILPAVDPPAAPGTAPGLAPGTAPGLAPGTAPGAAPGAAPASPAAPATVGATPASGTPSPPSRPRPTPSKPPALQALGDVVGLEPGAARTVWQQSATALHRCRRQGAEGFHGRVTFELSTDGAGTVRGVSLVPAGLPPDFASCLRTTARKLRFPPLAGAGFGVVTATWAF